MAQTAPVQAHTATGWVVILLLTPLLAWDGVAALFGPSETNPKHVAIQLTALGTFFGWALGFAIAYARRGESNATLPADAARLIYTWGCAMCLLHIAVAFHLAHTWSHAAAFDHVERASGFGAGLYVNYLFAVVWVADAAWAWISFESYTSRPRWLNGSIHGFMAFIMFNAAVVFNTGFGRALCALFFVALVVQAQIEWRRGGSERGETHEPGRGPGSVDASQSAAGHSPT